ncbi:MAG: chloride channel protein, partial [Candidatus Hodarchaeota archaeon]
PEVIQAVALKNGVIRPRVVLVKSIASAITIGTGGSVGREGPIVQIGSALGSTIGQWLKVSPERLKVLVGCGAAAGIAATFNAPIAGAFFALEVILGNFALPSFSPIIISSVLATAVSRAFLGDYPAFIVPAYSLVSVWEIPLYVLLGIVTGGVAVIFSKSVYKSEDLFEKFSIPDYLKNPIGGLLMGILIIFAPHVYGVGYETIDLALGGNLLWYSAVMLILIKLLATSITLGSGGSGGIFAPSLFLGAVTGSAFGNVVNYFFPTVTANSGAYAMVGMGAVVAAATHAPITSILILFELTSDYKIILALMVACTISTIMARKLYEDSIYTLKLTRRGISLNQGREEIIMKSFSVGDVMKTEAPIIHECTSFNDIIKIFMEIQEPYYYVINDDKEFLGILPTHVIKSVLHDENLQHLVIARDLIDSPIKTVSINNNLAECMDVFSRVEHEHLPVVEGNGSMKLLGSISRRDIFRLYNREILRKDVLGLKFVREIGEEKKRSHVELPREYKVDYVPLPKNFIGKTLKELDIRAKYSITIIAVKKRMGGITGISEIPSPDRMYEDGDILIIVGKENDVERFKREETWMNK